MKIERIFNVDGQLWAELENGQWVANKGSMFLSIYKKTEKGFVLTKGEIVAGIMMRTEPDFRWCVEHMSAEHFL